MKIKKDNLRVWYDALKQFETNDKRRYSLTKDTVQRRLRPEPEIIEHVLEELEGKIRHYFNLFKLEKEKRSYAEKNNYYLQEELAKAYEALEKNKVYTMKLEEKLNNIKDNQTSLIDTVRRIDLLYIQLDTLVQSFAGICTQIAVEVTENDSNVEKKRNTIKMLLDYIYPCRTLDPRINSLYGLLYYQTIGLLKEGKFSCPPIPPIPPVVPSQNDGWLPPSHFHHDNIEHINNLKETSFADMVKLNKEEADKANVTKSKYMSEYTLEGGIKYKDNSNGLQELLGFDIKIGLVEFKYHLENPKIVCVVRYDHETAYSAIQNSKRVTKPQNPYEITPNGKYLFNVDNTINLNHLPPKKPGITPNFKIDVHDVRGKALLGTAKCSFISEKTLIKNCPWDIYSRIDKNNPEVIGKIYVSVYQYPSKSILPAESFKYAKQSKFSDNSSINKSQAILQKIQKPLNKGTKAKLITKKITSLNKDITQKTEVQTFPTKMQIIKNKNPASVGKKVSFKPYTSKKETLGLKTDNVKELKKANVEVKSNEMIKLINKDISKGNTYINNSNNNNSNMNNNIENKNNNVENKNNNIENKNNNIDTKKMESVPDVQSENKPSNVKNLIKNLTQKIELKKSSIPPSILKNSIKIELIKEKEVPKKNELERKKSSENKKVSLKNEENIKSIEQMEERNIKIKLPLYNKKETKMKPIITQLSNKVEDKIENNTDKSVQIKSDLVESKDIPKNKIRPALKINLEPKKENLNKLLNKIGLKLPYPKENESKEPGNVKSSTSLSKELENKDATVKAEIKTSKSLTKTFEGEKSVKSESIKSENIKDINNKRPMPVIKLNIEKKEPHETKKRFFFFKKNILGSAEVPKTIESKTKNVEISKFLKNPVTKNDVSAASDGSSDSAQLKTVLESLKKKAVFIDKSKVQVKLTKNVKPKREIKKFIPKYTNIE